MSTSQTPPTPGPSSIDRILSILDFGLKSASALTGGPLGAGLNLADMLLQIGAHAKQVYEKEIGQPYDLSKVPLEEHV
jgi:hypothetical protein